MMKYYIISCDVLHPYLKRRYTGVCMVHGDGAGSFSIMDMEGLRVPSFPLIMEDAMAEE